MKKNCDVCGTSIEVKDELEYDFDSFFCSNQGCFNEEGLEDHKGILWNPHTQSPYTIGEWYEDQTGRSAKQGFERIKKIEEFLEKNDLTLSEITLEMHKDSIWNERRNRTDLEAKAEMIGYTNHKYHGFCTEMWWVMEKENENP